MKIEESRVAKRNIPVWKWFECVAGGDRTPYRAVLKTTVITTPAQNYGKKGGYHCFGSKKLAHKYSVTWSERLIQLYIPKGTPYHKGKVDGIPCLGAKKLRERK